MRLRNKLSQLKKHYHLTREDIASRLGVSHMTVYRWERNKTVPKSVSMYRKVDELVKELKEEK